MAMQLGASFKVKGTGDTVKNAWFGFKQGWGISAKPHRLVPANTS